jgi:hypothetical protein
LWAFHDSRIKLSSENRRMAEACRNWPPIALILWDRK